MRIAAACKGFSICTAAEMEFMMIATILISVALFVIVLAIILNMLKKKKDGKTASCGCGCSSCAMSGLCHKKEE